MFPDCNIRRFIFKASSLFYGTSLFLLAISSTLSAQTQTDLRIADVRFGKDRPQFGGASWMVMEVRLEVRNNSDRSAPNRQFLDDIELYVALAHNMGTQSKPQLEYFWTQVGMATLERGSHRIRFYLPPEQIKRGQMSNSEPYAWYVQARYGGASGTIDAPLLTTLAVSKNLRGPDRLTRFQELLDAQKDARAGILLPQVETPFRDMYRDETPTIRGYQRGER